MKRIFVLLTLTILISATSKSQVTINASGNVATGVSGQVSYSIGNCSYSSYYGTNGFIIENVQQPFEISIITEIDISKNITLTMSVYPNPTTDYLILNINGTELSNLSYRVFDLQGKELKSDLIKENITNIDFVNLKSSTYFVDVIQNGKSIKVFKVVKN